MDRLEWCDAVLRLDEKLVHKQEGVKLYDGDTATSFENGEAVLTPFRLLWRPPGEHKGLALDLDVVVFVEDEARGFMKSAKVVLHLSKPKKEKNPGPLDNSPYDHIKLSFKSGGAEAFSATLKKTLEAGAWKNNNLLGTISAAKEGAKKRVGTGVGILGIERSIEARNRQTGENISRAFQDMKVLMAMASDMVSLAKNISQKMRERKGSVSDDETVEFKSALLRLGVANPAVAAETGGAAGSAELAKEMAAILKAPLKDAKGIMPLADAYCIVNRARSLVGLVSPEDIIAACEQLEVVTRGTDVPMVYKVFPSGLKCIELAELDDDRICDDTMAKLGERTSLSAEELAKLLSTSVILAQQRLLLCEDKGLVCRDDSAEGLCFYPNRFLFP